MGKRRMEWERTKEEEREVIGKRKMEWERSKRE